MGQSVYFLKLKKSALHFKNTSVEFGQDCSSYTGGFEVNRDCSGDTIHVHLEAGHDLSFNYSFSFSGFFTLLNVQLEKVTVEDAIWRLVTYTTPTSISLSSPRSIEAAAKGWWR